MNMDEKRAANLAVQKAVRKGLLVPTDTCQTCSRGGKIVGHHYRGHAYQLDVWWVCVRCNNRLSDVHDGSLTLEQAQTRCGYPGTGRTIEELEERALELMELGLGPAPQPAVFVDEVEMAIRQARVIRTIFDRTTLSPADAGKAIVDII